MAVAIAGYLAWMLITLGGKQLTTAVDDFGELVAAAIGAGLCLNASRALAGHRRRGWLLLGLSAASWCLGQTVWTYLEVFRGELAPFPSPADGGFLIAVPLAVAAVLQFLRGSGLVSTRVVLDGAIVAAALFFISWVTLLEPSIRGGSAGFNLYLGLAYPVGDIVTLVVVTAAVSRSQEFDWALGIVAAGLVAIAVSDSFFLYLTTNHAFNTNPVNTGWFAGYLLLGLSGVSAAGSLEPDRRAETTGSLRVLLPYVPLLGASALAGVILLRDGSFGTVGALTLLLLVGLVLLRQVVAVREVARLSGQLAHSVAQLEMREQDLSYQTLHDPLTKLGNRVLFRSRLDYALEAGRREPQSIAVMFIDLDGFKEVNDSLGHDAGDRMLVAVAERIRACMRPGDTVARFGGDEFAVMLLGVADSESVRAVVRRLRTAFETAFTVDRNFLLGLSIGVVMTATDAGVPAVDLLRRADIAMYAAKAAGKNGEVFYDQSMTHAAGIGATSPAGSDIISG